MSQRIAWYRFTLVRRCQTGGRFPAVTKYADIIALEEEGLNEGDGGQRLLSHAAHLTTPRPLITL